MDPRNIFGSFEPAEVDASYRQEHPAPAAPRLAAWARMAAVRAAQNELVPAQRDYAGAA
jgi:hypothetical protein